MFERLSELHPDLQCHLADLLDCPSLISTVKVRAAVHSYSELVEESLMENAIKYDYILKSFLWCRQPIFPSMLESRKAKWPQKKAPSTTGVCSGSNSNWIENGPKCM